ncbi:hypothetical protein AMJ49_00605 [Parcubacteria bacterium DG_74_2]|nr:MAG: hypothetical protein AMJ49_00605 [Parcubacteria bacterium DG_74_2]
MSKKLLALGAVLAVVAGVAALSAYEAHVINVTAHIENALDVHPESIAFGTVFPQEYVESDFTVSLSTSFLGAGRVDDVEYVIKQKPKPMWDDQTGVPVGCYSGARTIDEARAYCHDYPEDLDCCYLSLCPFLSKLDGDPADMNDYGVPSYYQGTYCEPPYPEYASGYLSKIIDDISDSWLVDLKVPPVAGYVGQDWPESCMEWVVAENDVDYGCDLWVEVTYISEAKY